MKTVLILRHGKSDWDAEYDTDFDRPLARRGRKAATRVGRFLGALNQAPDHIIASPSVRTRQTIERAMEKGQWGSTLSWNENLYGGGVDSYTQALMGNEQDVSSAMVVGHEPTCSMLVEELIGDALVRFPTAGLARIDFEIEQWQELPSETGTLIWFVIPRILKAF